MMVKLIVGLLCIVGLWAEEGRAEVDVAKVSEALGHLLGKNLESMGVRFDVAKVAQGLKDAYEGKEAPMTEAECVQVLAKAQEIAFKEQAEGNLKRAEEFLAANGEKEGVVTLEGGKLQYQVQQEGEGAVVAGDSTLLIQYSGKLLNGEVFGASKEEERVHLDETIPGFSKGLVGMHEGEKRTLFIHPELGYGTHGELPPNSLLTFEVEVIGVDVAAQEPQDALMPTSENPEIASPFQEPAVLR